MHIFIDNSLPSVSIQLSLKMDKDNGIRMLVDTGVAMNSGHLGYQLWVVYQCPDIVAEFLQCGKVQLLAVLDLNLG